MSLNRQGAKAAKESRGDDGGNAEDFKGGLAGFLTRIVPGCIRFRMTKVLTVRIDPALLAKAEARAARLGVDRAQYVRSLIEEDVAGGEARRSNRFSSDDLAGLYEGTGKAATNQETRNRLRRGK